MSFHTERRPLDLEADKVAAFIDTRTASEDLFRILTESEDGMIEANEYTFNGPMTDVPLPEQLDALSGRPDSLTVRYAEQRGRRPLLLLLCRYSDLEIHLERLGEVGPFAPFALSTFDGQEERRNFAPVPAGQVTQMLSAIALRGAYGRAERRAGASNLDVQDANTAQLLKIALDDKATSVAHNVEYETPVHGEDLTLHAVQKTDRGLTDYQLTLIQTTVTPSLEAVTIRSAVEVPEPYACSTLPETYSRSVIETSPRSMGVGYYQEEDLPLTGGQYDVFTAACRQAAFTQRHRLQQVESYEPFADQQRRKDDPRPQP